MDASGDVSALSASLTGLAKLVPDSQGYLGTIIDRFNQEFQTKIAAVNAAESGDSEDALIHAEAGPVPTVKLPWQGGGPVSESEGDCTLDLFSVIHIPLATDLKVSTEGAIGAAGYSHTESESSDNIGLIYFGNDKIDTECLATLQDIEAKTDISDGQYVDITGNSLTTLSASLKDLPEHPDKNDELTDFQISIPAFVNGNPATVDIELSLTANEQDEEKNAVTVTGLHSEFKLTVTSTLGVIGTLTARWHPGPVALRHRPAADGHHRRAEVHGLT